MRLPHICTTPHACVGNSLLLHVGVCAQPGLHAYWWRSGALSSACCCCCAPGLQQRLQGCNYLVVHGAKLQGCVGFHVAAASCGSVGRRKSLQHQSRAPAHSVKTILTCAGRLTNRNPRRGPALVTRQHAALRRHPARAGAGAAPPQAGAAGGCRPGFATLQPAPQAPKGWWQPM